MQKIAALYHRVKQKLSPRKKILSASREKMLLVFRLYRRHDADHVQNTAFSPDLGDVWDTALYLRGAETDLWRVYDLEIIPIPGPIISTKSKKNPNVTMSPMNMEFAVFVRSTGEQDSAADYWFSFVGLWHFLYNKDRIHTISVDERMSGHFMHWQTLLAQDKTAKKVGKILTHINPQSPPFWPVDEDTIFISTPGLWHFTFSSPQLLRAIFLERLLRKSIYPILARIRFTAENPPINNPVETRQDARPSRFARRYGWITRCINALCTAALFFARQAK